jgi:hypothetical protein
MTYKALTTSFLLLAAACLGAWGQTPPTKLNCNQAGLAINGLVSFCQIQEVSLPAAANFTVSDVNGGVSVQTWDGPGILVRSQIRTAALNVYLAETLASEVVVDTSAGNVVVTGPSTNSYQNWSAKLEIFVPAATAIGITTANGSVAISDVQGSIQFNVANGSVSLARAGGNVSGNVANGSVLIGVGGNWAGQTLDVKTANGSIEIDVPADCAAHVTAKVSMGTFNTNFPVQIPLGQGLFGLRLSFDVGSGAFPGSAISMSTSLGTIQLRSID